MRIDDFRSYVDGAKLNIKEGNAPMHLMLNDPYERQDLSGWLPAPMTRADQDAIIEKAYAELDAEKRLILTDADRKILTDLAQTIEHMSRPGLMLDEPEDPHYPPIEVAESDLGAYHLPLLKEILSRDLDRRVMEPEFTAEVSTGTVKALEERLAKAEAVAGFLHDWFSTGQAPISGSALFDDEEKTIHQAAAEVVGAEIS